MPKISLKPDSAPELLLYKYFKDIIETGQLVTYKNKTVPFMFGSKKKPDTYPHIRLDFVRFVKTDRLRYIGDDVVVLDTQSNLYHNVTIGEPQTSIWTLSIEANTRDAVYTLLATLRAKFRRTGCIYEPVYIEHSREDRYDFIGTNELIKGESDELMYIGKLGFRLYTRLSGGYPIADYEPRPPVQQINTGLGVDNTKAQETNIVKEGQ